MTSGLLVMTMQKSPLKMFAHAAHIAAGQKPKTNIGMSATADLIAFHIAYLTRPFRPQIPIPVDPKTVPTELH